MRRLLLAIVLAFAGASAIAAPELTAVSGKIYAPNGTVATAGTVTFTLSTSGTTLDGANQVVVASRVQANIATDGSVSVSLVPNDAITPAGTYYTVSYSVRTPTSASWTEKWIVTTLPDPVAIGAVVRIDTPPGVTSPVSYVQEEGTRLNRCTDLNFIGTAVTATYNSGTHACDLDFTPASGGASSFSDILPGTLSAGSYGVGTGATLAPSGGTIIASQFALDPTDCSSPNFVRGINASGLPSCSQPTFTEISGLIADAQIPSTIARDSEVPALETDPTVPLLALSDLGDLCAAGESTRRNPSDTGNECYTPSVGGEANVTADVGGAAISLRGSTPKSGIALNVRTLPSSQFQVSSDIISIKPGGVTGTELAANTVDISANTNLAVAAPATLTGDTVSVQDASTGAKGVIQLAGDLNGTAAAPTIANKSGSGSFMLSTGPVLGSATVATLPAASGTDGRIYVVTDSASVGDCTTGGGVNRSLCRDNGSTWGSIGDGGTGTPGVGLVSNAGALDFASNELNALTWGTAGASSILWTWDLVSGTDPTMLMDTLGIHWNVPGEFSGGSDGTWGVVLNQNTSAIENPSASKMTIGFIGTHLYMRAPSGTAREVLNTAGGDYGGFTCTSGACATDAGTIGPTELASTAVTPGTYNYATLTVDQQGRITSAASGTNPAANFLALPDTPDSYSGQGGKVPQVNVGETALAFVPAISVTESSPADAHMLLYDSTLSPTGYANVAMSGDATITKAGVVSVARSFASDFADTLASQSPALGVGESRFTSSTTDCVGGGIISEGSVANSGQYALCYGNAGVGDRKTQLPVGSSTTVINVPAIENAQTWSGTQTFTTTFAKTENARAYSSQSSDIATALATLAPGTSSSSVGGLVVDPNEDDTALFKDDNPAGKNAAGTATGKLDAHVVDLRGGTIKFESSAPQYPIYASGDSLSDKGASKVPFSFYVRRDDASQPFADANANFADDDSATTIGEWNCMQNVGHCTTTTTTTNSGSSSVSVNVTSSTKFANGEVIRIGSNGVATIVSGGGTTTWTITPAQTWSNGATVVKPCVTSGTCTSEACTAYSTETTEYYNCPNLLDPTNARNPWGQTGASYWWMHAGVGPQEHTSAGGTRMSTGSQSAGGPGIFDVGIIDEQGGARPIFHIGTAGAAIYEPLRHSDLWDGWLTMFRGEESDFWSSSIFNTPMYSFTKYGLYADGGIFNGGVNHWPRFTNNAFPSYWGIWSEMDGDGTQPQLVIATSASTGAGFQRTPMVRFLNRYGLGTDNTWNEGTNQYSAFEFMSNSVLNLKAYDLSGSGLDHDQRINFHGTNTTDSHYVSLGIAANPTTGGAILVDLPNKPGTAIVAPNSTHTGPLMWGDSDDTADTGDEVCAAAGLACANTLAIDGSTGHACSFDWGTVGTTFYAQCKRI